MALKAFVDYMKFSNRFKNAGYFMT